MKTTLKAKLGNFLIELGLRLLTVKSAHYKVNGESYTLRRNWSFMQPDYVAPDDESTMTIDVEKDKPKPKKQKIIPRVDRSKPDEDDWARLDEFIYKLP